MRIFSALSAFLREGWPIRLSSAGKQQEAVSEITLSLCQSMQIFSRFPGRSRAAERQYWRERFSVTYGIRYLASAS
jgi:hypothetical protein